MINLLPPDEKRQLRAGRTNSLLIRYNIALVVAVLFLLASIGVVYVYLNNTKTTAENVIKENKAKVVSYSAVEAQAAQFRVNLSTAKQILDREVNYTKVILQVAQLMPAGTVLDSLDLDASTFGTETTLTAQATTYSRALALKDSVQKSPLFSNVHFDSITSDTTNDKGAYPVTINLSVTIKKDAAKQ